MVGMSLKKTTIYIDDDLLSSVKALAVARGEKIHEVLDVALRRYFDGEEIEAEPRPRELYLAEALSGQQLRASPGVPREKAARLSHGEMLSEAVLAERESHSH